MIRVTRLPKLFSWADIFILMMVGGLIYGTTFLARQWNGEFKQAVEIDLSLASLPLYTFFSAARGFASYFISLVFALLYGYAAAKIPRLERILIPLLDILQCIPVLGFLPGLVLGCIALFPHSNVGLEIATILMIFTSQAWNMAFSFYASLRGIPQDLKEMSAISGLSWRQRFLQLELPVSAVGLVWNSLMSMAGGWFFLTICESFTLGARTFRLPGLGAYMAVAIERGNTRAMLSGVLAMMLLIVLLDFLLWRPVLVWVRRFSLDTSSEGVERGHSFLLQLFQESRLLSGIQALWKKLAARFESVAEHRESVPLSPLGWRRAVAPQDKAAGRHASPGALLAGKAALYAIGGSLLLLSAFAVLKLALLLQELDFRSWVILLRNTFWTMLRVFIATALSTLWTLPVGVIIGRSPRIIRVAQPIVQIIAAFPAPMIYPLVLAALFHFGIALDYGSVVLMALGVQWYVLFNVLAGAMGIDRDLQASMALGGARRWTRWSKLYIPAVFPSLVVGWITAAGGAWNASIVTEYYRYDFRLYASNGLGASISHAAESANFPLLAASIAVMVVVVVALNRLVWHPLTILAERRFRFDR